MSLRSISSTLQVSHLRKNLKDFKKGMKTPLTEDQVRQLEDLGFCRPAWIKMHNALRVYKGIHGHCNVSEHSPLYHKLGSWVQAQRRSYKNKSRNMTPERIRRLEDLSFQWRLHDRKNWWDEYQLLREYWVEHGDFNIPTDKPEGLHLVEWAKVQRRHYKRRQQGDYSFLTDDRVRALDAIDFVWDKFEARWMERFSQLGKFRSQYGHCNVTKNSAGEYGTLYSWVRQQRHIRKLGDTGMGKPMPMKRIKLLDEEGFVWDAAEELWNQNYEKLVHFQRSNGHCDVQCTVNEPLYVWIWRLREAYKKFRDGKKSTLNFERIMRLEKIGFQWTK
uniref:Helicase-associated domain-containing protein n=1 Tax=Odontella aurita TaxID=265563 RepID=A0A7S4JDH0_9STRA|mmetsp:Transcript_44343/g.135136  ORF Transcript_44343/g.135136 Transcript_44343/m.135136 type:complete len:332 (+) Transcript_44343:867-1862(+)